MKRTLIILLLGPGIGAAEPKEPDMPKSVVPESKLRAEQVQTATLPELLREALLAEEEFSQGTDNLPKALYVLRIDLNGDGSPEYIVDSNQYYSGGAMHMIFERRKKSYESIGDFQGGFHLAARVNGYYQICAVSRGGGGHYTYYIMRFSKGQYRDYKNIHVNFNEP